MMNGNEGAAREWDRALERLAAEVTTTAYAIALRHRAGGSWLDLELALWEALARTVRDWGPLPPGPRAQERHSGERGNDRSEIGTVLPREKE
jgi:hypothetical protein